MKTYNNETRKAYTEAVEIAFTKVRNFVYGDLSDEDYIHVIDIAVSVLFTRDGILQGGSFVDAIVKNDLEAAFSRADSVCTRAIKFFVYCKSYVYPKSK
jgi:hypothetical protein